MTLDDIRAICKKLPHVTEDIKWGHDLCFCIGEKMFCVTGLEGPLQVSMKVLDEEFDELSSSKDILPAPYVARYKWVLVQKPNRFTKKQWEHYITQSYWLIRDKLPSKIKNKFK